jgi:carboxyl-terminal processing protease
MISHPMAALALLLWIPDAAAQAQTDYAADAASIERLVNDNYAYLERFPGRRMPMTEKLRGEASKVASEAELIRYAERALTLLADHHAITGSSLKDSWGVFPSYGDLWIEPSGGKYVITVVREASPAATAGIREGDVLVAIDGQPAPAAVAAFWSDLGATGGGERDGYAARVLAAGRRDRPRRLTIGHGTANPRAMELPNLYSNWRPDHPAVTVTSDGAATRIKFNDSLGDSEAIAAFDAAMAQANPGRSLVIDLTDTASGGNTSVARAIMGWFVRRPSFYQVHNLPSEERETGIARHWVEQVLPRQGKYWGGPVTVRVGRWTGSMGEGIAIGFAAFGKRVEGDRMAGLLGAVYDYRLEKSGQVIKFPSERLSAVDGTPRERFMPRPVPPPR